MTKTILIYDDDAEILFLCKAILSKEYRVQTFSRCDTAVEDAKTFQPDLILMDLWIPQIGGQQAIKLLKADLATDNIPVDIFSANSGLSEMFKGLNADGFLEKPFDISALKATIAKYIN